MRGRRVAGADRVLEYDEFLELIVRIANEKYSRDEAGCAALGEPPRPLSAAAAAATASAAAAAAAVTR